MSVPADRGAELVARDARVLWHPYTQHATEAAPLPVARAQDASLFLADGSELIDAISSWWSCLHGHGRPELVAALSRQAAALDHVLFAGATHEPAVALAERLIEVTPGGLTRVFFSDNGSTAVEVALKMAYQAWVHRGEPQRKVLVALTGGYHGDTFGAMAVGDPEPFFRPFQPLLFPVLRVAPEQASLEAGLEELGDRAAGVIIEPLVQGAAGMVMHPPAFVAAARAACDCAGVPLIADEVLTGFGRTGSLFACGKAGVLPDLLCLGKGLSGGVLPLAATLATEEIYRAFLSADRGRAFFHGHTFTANPIACAAGLASLEIVLREDVPGKLERIGRTIEEGLAPAARAPGVRELRRTGGIVALELEPRPGEAAGYLAALGPRLRAAAIQRGVLLRPLGNVLYAMPPACTTEEQCRRIAAVMAELALF
ncbi:MAG: adenosylmethionine--8-amino-7-oxononanoate transaminase [Planctomycetes bacterium]|nr:adenosylmethionine--8-amino-7-oxononanoate transaminase [Planctomycetota bacterium]